MTSNISEIKINYQEYPECMFAMIAAFLPDDEGDEIRLLTGKVFFRSEDECGNTYRNGLLHSYDDEPAIRDFFKKSWFKDGKLHRDGDKPACTSKHYQCWYKNGKRHREGDKPAFESPDRVEWYKNGIRHREIADGPAVIDNMDGVEEWWVHGEYLYSIRE